MSRATGAFNAMIRRIDFSTWSDEQLDAYIRQLCLQEGVPYVGVNQLSDSELEQMIAELESELQMMTS